MRVGILSDTHDRVPAVAGLVRMMIERGASLIMHAGDYCSPFSLVPFQDENIPLLGVFGCNDGDHAALSAYASSMGVGAEIYGSPHSFDVNGKQVLIVHDINEIHERSLAKHQFVIHGATHKAEISNRGDTLLVNPGEACGWLHGECTGALLDFRTKQVEILKLTDI